MSSSGSRCSRSSVGLAQARGERERGAARPRSRTARAATASQRQPQRGGGRAGARALEADLAQMQLVGREVRVRRVVRVQAPDAGIGEQDRPAAVGLEAVLVRVDDDRVGARRSRAARRGGVVEQREEAAVRGVDVDADAVALAQRAAPRRSGRPRRARWCPPVSTTVPMSPRAHAASSASRSIRPSGVGRDARSPGMPRTWHMRACV